MTKDEFNTATSTTTTNTTNSTTQPYHRRNAERRLSAITDDDDNDNNLNDKSRKFRWSSCFSFISTKFKKSKSPSHNKIRTSQSFEDFDSKKVNYVGPTDLFPEETIEGKKTSGLFSQKEKKRKTETNFFFFQSLRQSLIVIVTQCHHYGNNNNKPNSNYRQHHYHHRQDMVKISETVILPVVTMSIQK